MSRFYIANRIGWDHVGLGSDFDGIASVIPGLQDVRCYPALLEAILERGATEEQLAKVTGGNMIRVWKGAVQTREQMKAEGVLPVEDVWEGRTWWRYDGYCKHLCCFVRISVADRVSSLRSDARSRSRGQVGSRLVWSAATRNRVVSCKIVGTSTRQKAHVQSGMSHSASKG